MRMMQFAQMPPKKKQKTDVKADATEEATDTKRQTGLDEVKLPSGVVPSHYALTLVPDLENFKFSAYVEIDVQVKPGYECGFIRLHAVDLLVNAAGVVLLRPNTQQRWSCSQVLPEAKTQTLKLHFSSNALPPAQYRLEIKYVGVMNDKLCGLYRSSYTTPSGESKVVLCTQFEATDARRCLPCWDEPALKATFDVAIAVPPYMEAVSNMPVKSEATVLPDKEAPAGTSVKDTAKGVGGLEYPVGWRLVSYLRSPVMSTYLLAVVVGELDYIAAYTQPAPGRSPVLVRVYTPPGKTAQGQFALDLATKALEIYNQWFGIPFPLPKVDLLAIPDFAAGAMENWGCITYREVRLLVDAKGSSRESQRAAARTICHELAHMWFGNLVTMDWWTNLWLNEGFARFMEFLCLSKLFPDWDMWVEFTEQVSSRAKSLDALRSTHAVEVPVKWPEEINEIFDLISYAKGGTVIRMLADTLGEDTFQRGLQSYLQTHSYRNACTEDLWQALQQSSSRDVTALLSPWVKQVGFPLVTLTRMSRTEEGGLEITLTQKRFLAEPSGQAGADKADGTADDTPWTVPLRILVGRDGLDRSPADHSDWQVEVAPGPQEQTFSLSKQEVEARCGKGEEEVWVKLNGGSSTMCRVRYLDSQLLLGPLSAAVRQCVLSTTDRLDLVQDTCALASAGELSLPVALRFLRTSCRQEQSKAVWVAIAEGLGEVLSLHGEETQPHNRALKQLVAELFGPIYSSLGWEAKAGEEGERASLRPVVLKMMGRAGDHEVAKQARVHLAAFLWDEDKNPLPADLRGMVYKTAVQHGGTPNTEWQAVRELFRRSDLSEEKRRCLTALGGCAGNPKLIGETLKWGLESGEVREQDLYILLESLSGHTQGRRAVWAWLTGEWSELSAKYKQSGQNVIFSGLIGAALRGWSTLEAAEEFERFFQEHPCPAAARVIAQASERVRARALQRVRQSQELASDSSWTDCATKL
eukprot:g54899.t1